MNLNLAEKLKTGLTPQEKIDCYEQAIENIRIRDNGVCIELFRIFKTLINERQLKILYPEFLEAKPTIRDYNNYWFNSTEERIEVLNKLIEEQKKLI